MSSTNGDHQDQRNQDQRNARLAELEATRRQIEAYQTLLQEVPTVFERKFRERMQPVLERNREIAAESQLLREQLSGALPPGTATEVAQLPANAGGSTTLQADNPADNPNAFPQTGCSDSANADHGAALTPGSDQGARARQLLRMPRRWPRALLWGSVGTAVLGFSLLTLGPVGRQHPLAQFLRAGTPTPADPNALGPEELQIISNGSWIEVEDASGKPLFAGILEGERRFPIGPGLRLNAGRPDLVRYRIGKRPAAPLGAIEDVGWRTLASPLTNPDVVPIMETGLLQP
ncbi:MAG: DUF4115 domain-containing protein [Synechococcaceae cyanobacterium]|jgi:hypothetical protein